MTATLLHGDCRTVLPTLPAQSVQCVVTSPPYFGLRDYGVDDQIGLEPTPAAYVAALVAVFAEVWRVLKDDGTLWLNLGDSYASTPSGAIASSGIEGSQSGQSAFRMASRNKTIPEGLKPKNLIGIPWRVAFALQDAGWYLRSDIIWHKPNPMPESVTDRPTKAHEYLFLLTKQPRYYYDADAIAEPASEHQGTAATFRRTNSKRGDSVVPGQGHGTHRPDRPDVAYSGGTRNRRTVWTIATRPYTAAHFATMPEALVEPCILAGSRPGDTVLDTFAGSGTVLRVAERLQRESIGIDLNADYIKLQERRTDGVQIAMVDL